MPRKPTAKRALDSSFSQKSTKSGGGKVIKKGNLKSTTKTPPKKTSMPRSGGVKAALVVKRKK